MPSIPNNDSITAQSKPSSFSEKKTSAVSQTQESSLQSIARPLVPLAVFGLHLSGQPLNHQLIELGGHLLRVDYTSADYQLFVILDAQGNAKPAAVLNKTPTSMSIELEIWELPLDQVGKFLFGIPAPLGLGTVILQDGSPVKGFICEGGMALANATEITQYGGWRAYLREQNS